MQFESNKPNIPMPQDLVKRSNVLTFAVVLSTVHLVVYLLLPSNAFAVGAAYASAVGWLYIIGPSLYYCTVYFFFFFVPFSRWEKKNNVSIPNADRPHPFHTGKFFLFVLFFGGSSAFLSHMMIFNPTECGRFCLSMEIFLIFATPTLLISVIGYSYMSWSPEKG
jgi:hypothetical protein